MLSYTFISISANGNILPELEEAEKLNIKKMMNDINLIVPYTIDKRVFECKIEQLEEALRAKGKQLIDHINRDRGGSKRQ